MDSSTTTRIDLQKLQLLNDRICQALDALNQVRLSAQATTMGFGWQNPYVMAAQPIGVPGFANAGYGAPNFANAYGVPAFANPGYGVPGYGIPAFGYPQAVNPWQQIGLGPVAGVYGHNLAPNGHIPTVDGRYTMGHVPSYPMGW